MAPGARNMFCAPCSNLRFFGSKCTVLEKVLMTLLWLFGPRSDSAQEEYCALLPPSLRLWCYVIKMGQFSENKQIFKSERHELLFHEHLQFSNTIRHGSCIDCQQRLLLRYFRFLRVVFVSLLCLPHAFLRRGPVFVLLLTKLFRHSTSYFFKVR